VKHEEGNKTSPKLSLLKFLLLTNHHSHFLAATLDFTSFSQWSSWGPHTFFTAWYESYHKVETGYLIALKFGTQKSGVMAHLGTKFG